MADIHDNIFTLRKKNNMSLEELGKRIGTTKQTIQRYESREIKNIPYEKIIALAEVFSVSPAQLMGFSEEKPDYSKKNAMLANAIRKDSKLADAMYKLINLSEEDKSQIYGLINLIYGKQAD